MPACDIQFAKHAHCAVASTLSFIGSLKAVCVQAHVCQVGLKSVLAALRNHPSDTDIQAKALVVLGVLGQVRRNCLVLLPTPPSSPRCPKYLLPLVATQDVEHVEHSVMFNQLDCDACMDATYKS